MDPAADGASPRPAHGKAGGGDGAPFVSALEDLQALGYLGDE